MKIYSNLNNPAALKLSISSKFALKNTVVDIVSCEDKRFQSPKRLPVLELDSGVRLFSTNTSSRYLLPPLAGNIELLVDKWLEFEAVQLLPTIIYCFNSTGKVNNNLRDGFSKYLTLLDGSLAEKQFLSGDSISVADISIWSSLFPVLTEPKHQEAFFSNKLHLTSWFKRLQSLPQFESSVREICPNAGVSCLQNLVNALWLPLVSGGDISSAEVDGSPVKEAKEIPITEEELKVAEVEWKSLENRKLLKPPVKPVLPIKGERNIIITSALPYVNNVPHLGNIIGCVLSADVFARFCRLRNYNTLYISGTDEYGTATETKALEEGLTPQQICDKYFKIHDEIYRWFNISFDHFGRTTTKKQTEICQEMFLDLHKNGLMTTESMEQLLCQKCDRYLADRFVEGTCPKCKYEDARGDQCDGCGNLINATELIKPRCKVCSTAPVIRNSDQFFLELPKVEPRLRQWLDSVTDGWSHNAKVITKSWLKDGLKPRCITRDLKWGIPVPLPKYADKVFYVWFDAPIGYLSMSACYTDQWRQWWQPKNPSEVTLYQFMAKDNVPFHSVMFPSSLIGSDKGYLCVGHLMATEYLNYEDGKFSKSRGVGVFGTDARDTGITSDVWRFYLLYVRPEGQDSTFSWVDLATKNNSELLNNLGNFVYRALMFAERNFACLVPKIILEESDIMLLALVNQELHGYITSLEKAKLREGIRYIFNISRHGNQYMQSSQPWVLLKGTDEEKNRAGTVIGLCCNICSLLAILLHPYMPETSLTLQKQLNIAPDSCIIPSHFAPILSEGHELGKPAPLFTKIEMELIETLKKKYAGNQKSREDTPVANDVNVTNLTAAVAKQAEVVRRMKSSGIAKADWQPHVATLLDLKKQLAVAEAAKSAVKPDTNPEQAAKSAVTPVTNPEQVAELEILVGKQAEIVRGLKAGGATKSDVVPQVAILLDLKKRLALAQGTDAASTGGKNKKKS